MVGANRIFSVLAVFFVFSAALIHAERDTYWDEYKFDAKGTFKLVSVTHNETPNGRGCTFKSAQGAISGTCTYQAERESGSASGSVTWNEPPATAKEGQEYLVTSTLSSSTEGVYYGRANSQIVVDSGAGLCSSFHDIGTDFSIPRVYVQHYSEGTETKTLNYRFPTFYKPWICNQLTTAENNKGQGGETMRLEAQRKGVYFFNMTVYAETVGGEDAYVYTYEWVPGGSVSGDLSGRITDGHNDPMPYINVTLKYLGKDYSTLSDGAGNYAIAGIDGFSPDGAKPPEGVLTVYAEYWRDGKNYFSLYDSIDGNRMVALQKKFLLRDSSDTAQNIDFSVPVASGIYRLKHGEPGADKVAWLKEGEEIASSDQLTNLFHIAPVYYYSSNAIDFMLTILKADIDYKLPVDIFVGGNGGTKYTRPDSSIYIDFSDLAYASSDRPRNREYHELSHHLLFSQWNGVGLRKATDANHGGFINSDTADAYTEGFAEFMALVIADYTNNPNDPQPSGIYAGFGSLETNLKPWEARGTHEELALAGVLWDLYDKNSDDGDTVSIPIQDLWPVLSEKRANVLEYSKSLKLKFPDKASAINRIFLSHGFFADKCIGNKVRDNFEPFIDANGNGNYDAGEKYVDYGINATRPEIVYDGTGEIGRATNYERPTRGKAVETPGAFLKVDDLRVASYTVSVHFNSPSQGKDYAYTVDQREGKIYLNPLPGGTNAQITVAPNSGEFSASKAYSISASDYLKKYNAAPLSQGYSDSFSFGLVPTGKADLSPALSGGPAPKWGTDKGVDDSNALVGSKPNLPLSAGGLAFPAMPSLPGLKGLPGASNLPCMTGLALLSLLLAVSFAGNRRAAG